MNLNTSQLLENAVRAGASDVFIVAGLPVSMRINGMIAREDECRLLPEDTRMVIGQIYHLAGNRPLSNLEDSGDDDFSFAIPGLSRFRVSAYKQRGALSVVIRIITFTLPDPKEIGLPDKIINFAHYSKGMVLVTGPAGSGKSTTLACIIDHINKSYDKHIITLEDPLEYLHRHNKSIVSQREINVDTQSYVTALRASLRQSPDVILLGEMRDYETMQVAMTAILSFPRFIPLEPPIPLTGSSMCFRLTNSVRLPSSCPWCFRQSYLSSSCHPSMEGWSQPLKS